MRFTSGSLLLLSAFATALATALAGILIGMPRIGWAQGARAVPPIPERYQNFETSNDASIEDLIKDRIDSEWKVAGTNFIPELMRTEADYARLSVTTPKVTLYEASFHLQPHYYSHASMGPDTTFRVYGEQPIMYYIGSARTPLALPVVSNLSKTLSGDEASYTVNIGVLPLPDLTSADSMRYFVIIERVIESNHTDNSVRLERFHKEFAAKVGEPVFLRLEDERPEKGEYIVQLESGKVLDFYDDFSRFIEEHIILKSDKLSFGLGNQTISDISGRLSIPYSVARTCEAKVQLLSVVDTAHPLTIVDTVRQPADYLAEVDMSKFADGPYQYRFTAIEQGTGKVLYSETHDFHKAAPIYFAGGSRIEPSDTLKVGGKQVDWAKLLSQTNLQLANAIDSNDRYKSTLTQAESDKQNLEQIVKANRESTIADVHFRAGLGTGASAGDNFFVGIESNRPSLAFDVSFGWLYGGTKYLSYTPPANLTQIFKSPSSLGFQLTWIPVKFFDGWIEPLLGVANYDLWSSATTNSSAALLAGQLGIASEPLGEMNGLGFSLAYEDALALGPNNSNSGLSFKAYVRF
ncbi:MAG TPA: hypothetical protein VFH95_15185 [Candidatus Kapabacteria bacterium]|nr:hypothetical protein [Candidatus Kapabacteria bacterium]